MSKKTLLCRFVSACLIVGVLLLSGVAGAATPRWWGSESTLVSDVSPDSTGEGPTRKDLCDFAQGFSVGMGLVSLFGCFACGVVGGVVGVGSLIAC